MGLCRSVDITTNCTNFEIKFISVIIYSYIYKYKLSYVHYLQGRTGPKCSLSAPAQPTYHRQAGRVWAGSILVVIFGFIMRGFSPILWTS